MPYIHTHSHHTSHRLTHTYRITPTPPHIPHTTHTHSTHTYHITHTHRHTHTTHHTHTAHRHHTRIPHLTHTHHTPYTHTHTHHTPLCTHLHTQSSVSTLPGDSTPCDSVVYSWPCGTWHICIKIPHGGDVPALNVCLKYKYFCVL